MASSYVCAVNSATDQPAIAGAASHRTQRAVFPATAPGPRLDALTGLRWIAAFAVFVYHARLFLPLPHMTYVAPIGNTGVTFFFVLSGFVLAWSFVNNDTAPRFYWRRFARIWPALAVSTVMAIPVFYYGRGIPFDATSQLGALASLVFVQSWFPSIMFAGNPAAWSLSNEAFFYLLFPFLIRPMLRLRVRWLAVIAVALIGLNLGVRWWSYGADLDAAQLSMLFVSPIGRLAEFILGMAGAAAMRRGWRAPIPVSVATIAVGIGLAVVWYDSSHPEALSNLAIASPIANAMNQVLGALYALLIVAVATRDLTGKPMLLRSRPMVRLGTWSYSFYLVHATVLYGLSEVWFGRQPASWNNLGPLLVALAIAIASAAALYRLVEHPAERALRRMLKRPVATVATPVAAVKPEPFPGDLDLATGPVAVATARQTATVSSRASLEADLS